MSCREVPAVDIPLDHPTASRVHAALCHHNDGRIFLIDLSSTHGTFVDGTKISPNKPTVLKNGMEIKFGQSETKFIMQDVESAGQITLPLAICCIQRHIKQWSC